jgi:hypothetical protein
MENRENNKKLEEKKKKISKKMSLESVINGSLFATSEEMEQGINGIMGIHEK